MINQASGSGRARRDAAARAMQGWHSQRMLGNGEVGDPIIKVFKFLMEFTFASFGIIILGFLQYVISLLLQDKGSVSLLKKDKHLKSVGNSYLAFFYLVLISIQLLIAAYLFCLFD